MPRTTIPRPRHSEAAHIPGGEVVRHLVFGANDGLVAAFAVVSGLRGAAPTSHIVFAGGLAELLGGVDEIYQAGLPSGIAQVPFVLDDEGKRTNMFVFAGIFGLKQDAKTLALEPRILWAVAREPAEVLQVMPRG